MIDMSDTTQTDSKASQAQQVIDDEDTLEEEDDPDSESSQEPPRSSPSAPVSPFPSKETGEADYPASAYVQQPAGSLWRQQSAASQA